MFITFVLSLVIVALALVFLCINMILKKNGKFPNMHIGASKAMADRGIKCVNTQDREAQMSNEK